MSTDEELIPLTPSRRSPSRRSGSLDPDKRRGQLAPEAHPPPAEKLPAYVPDGTPTDTLNRPLRDLRISITDRCNFRCTYCMPKEVFGRKYRFLPRGEVLSFEEIAR